MLTSACAPAPLIDMVPALKRYATVLTVESHYRTGGLGSMVSEIIAENGLICRLTRCGVAEAMDGITGSTEFLNARHGLTAPQIADAALKARASAVSH